MFVRKNLLHQADLVKRNNLLKGLALFFLGASAVLLFSSADLIITPDVSNAVGYLQKLHLSPSGTLTSGAKITLDGSVGSISATTVTATSTISAVNVSATNVTATNVSATNVSATNIVSANYICPPGVTSNCLSTSNLTGMLNKITTLEAKLYQFQRCFVKHIHIGTGQVSYPLSFGERESNSEFEEKDECSEFK